MKNKKRKNMVFGMLCNIFILGNIFAVQAEMPRFFLEDYPVIDGSLACVPLGVALTQKMTGCTEGEAEVILDRISNTNPCYLALAGGSVDFILAYEASDETKEKLKVEGNEYVELDLREIGQDALVFLVNEDNPIDSLTSEQIYDIFSGKITNWKDIGGMDQEIKAFQRPENSGSQTLMRKLLMGNTEMIESRISKVTTMEGMFDAIMTYDNDKNAIGYSVYYYAEKMMRRDGIKLLKISDVAPNHDTIFSGEYPLINPFYCGTSELSSFGAKQIQEWLLTSEGQDFIEECGYIRLVENR